jgi:hypothetical protein
MTPEEIISKLQDINITIDLVNSEEDVDWIVETIQEIIVSLKENN